MKTFITLGCLIGCVCAMAIPAFAGDETITLMLGGKFCDGYVGDVEHALRRVPGVKTVDFKRMKGHAVVTVESGKVKPEQLATAVNGVKGENWYCTGEVMK
ncbi:MAG: cation transporter [Nitrospirota bacterium]|nr:cation transporter [Nitrospirota bacterium]